MSIEETKDELIIRIPKKNNSKELQNAISYLTYKSIVKKSKAKQKDIDDLLKQIGDERRSEVRTMLKSKLNIDAK